MIRAVKWNRAAVKQLEKIIDYIGMDSETNSVKVEKVILSKIGLLLKNAEVHSLDKYKINNDGTFRAFEVYHCRVAYRIRKSEIRIIRIRHTRMSPLEY